MKVSEIRRMIDYSQIMNQRLGEKIAQLSDEQFTQEHDYSIGSVHNQAFHMLNSDWYFYNWMEGIEKWEQFKQEDFPTWQSINEKWQELDALINDALESLTEDKLDDFLDIKISEETTLQCTLWEAYYIYANHSTNHRAQVLALLHQLGGETFEQGYFFYMMDNQLQPAI